ncbi:hypothetical protein X778_10135 [Pseudomonas aeruginosa VRFPA07]|nr:hypothetical protein X778_10135 [Pseudomonas aeruginosa VRFPA07]
MKTVLQMDAQSFSFMGSQSLLILGDIRFPLSPRRGIALLRQIFADMA